MVLCDCVIYIRSNTYLFIFTYLIITYSASSSFPEVSTFHHQHTNTQKKDMVHIVCVSGTFSPPHRGHVLMAIESARSLRKLGKDVAAVCFIPVHDNYLRNKVSSDAKEDIAFSSSQRVAMLKELIAEEQADDVKCIALDWECENRHLLTESPGYWAKKLPGYLKTIPTKKLLPAFQSTFVRNRFGKDAKAAWVFGMDNLENRTS